MSGTATPQRYVKITREIDAEVEPKRTVQLRPQPAFAWELLDIDDNGKTTVAYLRSNPGGPVYVTDELDALEQV